MLRFLTSSYKPIHYGYVGDIILVDFAGVKIATCEVSKRKNPEKFTDWKIVRLPEVFSVKTFQKKIVKLYLLTRELSRECLFVDYDPEPPKGVYEDIDHRLYSDKKDIYKYNIDPIFKQYTKNIFNKNK